MSILIIAEHDHQSIKAATLNTVTAAKALGADIDILIAGENCANAANAAAQIAGIRNIHCADHLVYAHFLADNVAALAAELGKDYSYILAPATTTGKNIMPRLAALLDVQPISDITEIVSGDTFKRPVYAGNAIATVQSHEAIKCLTIRNTAFDTAEATGGSANIQAVDIVKSSDDVVFVKQELTKSERPELTAANIVVSGGRGVGSGENFAIIEGLADTLGAAVGASRAAVDAGFVPNDYQVGQTGKVVAPELYIAVGISGAIQHLAGMKDSKTIVAINKDEEAPIFQIADYGLVADLFEAVPALTDALKAKGIAA